MSNFLRDYEAAMVKYTDAPRIFHRALATSLMGAALTSYDNRCILYGGTLRRWTNMWTLVIGDSGRSRKTTTVHMMAEVMSRMESGEDLRAPDDGSPEGFAKDFVRRDRMKKGDAASLMVQGEMYSFLSSLMKDYMKSMKAMLMDFYDVPLVYRRTLSKEEFSVRRPRFSMVGGLASELLPSMTTSDDWLGGFLGRCLLIHASKDTELASPGTPSASVYASLAKQADNTLKQWRKTRAAQQKAIRAKEGKGALFLFNYNDKAQKRVQELQAAYPDVEDANVNILRSRSPLHLMKIAAAEQVCLDPSAPFISPAAVDSAAVLWEHYMKTSPTLLQASFARSNADLEGDRLQRRILRILTEVGDAGIDEFALVEATVLDWERYQKAMQTLDMLQKVDRVMDDAGRTRVKLRKG